MASYATPPPSQYRPPPGLDEKMLRSPSAPVLNPVAPSPEDGATRARATLPTKALPPVPMIAKEVSTGKDPSTVCFRHDALLHGIDCSHRKPADSRLCQLHVSCFRLYPNRALSSYSRWPYSLSINASTDSIYRRTKL